MTNTVDLDFFDGKTFVLTAVDLSKTFGRREWASGVAGGIAFTLDGVTYAAVEDPDDGYRSMLDRVIVMEGPVRMATSFPAHKVRARYATVLHGVKAEAVEFVDEATNKAVLVIGTGNFADYYPWFVGEFYPENLAANQDATA